MSTNFLIAYPSIPFASSLSASPSAVSGFEAEYTILGGTDRYYWPGSQASEHRITADLGADTTASAEYFCLVQSQLITKQDDDLRIRLQRSPDNSTWTDVLGATFPDNAYGPGEDIHVETFTETSAFRYWRTQVDLSGGGNCRPRIGKTFYGLWFDMQREPISDGLNMTTENRVFYPRRPPLSISLRWQGIPNAKAQEFRNTIVKKKALYSYVLYDANDYVLNGYTAMYCRLVSAFIEPQNAHENSITATFEELV